MSLGFLHSFLQTPDTTDPEKCQNNETYVNCYLPVLQIFHTLYHTDENVLLGAPTGSGKTISAELAILHAFAEHPGEKVVYIAPMKVRQSLGSRI